MKTSSTTLSINLYQELQQRFITHANSQKAQEMSQYMRHRFAFYGIQSNTRKELTKDIIRQLKKQKYIDWDLLDLAWENPHREFHYFVLDYLKDLSKFLTSKDIEFLEKYIASNQWWDSIDLLVHPIGDLVLRDPSLKELMISYSLSDDFWFRRIAILHQLKYKEKTDLDLLSTIILNNLQSSEFFINKAIGWSLREYSKTNPEWVKSFIQQNNHQLTNLSIKEGSKYLK